MTTSSIKMTNTSGNGYCKMSDGTLILYGKAEVKTTSSTSGAAFPYTGSKDIVFDTSAFGGGFGGQPMAFASIVDSGAYWNVGVRNVTYAGLTLAIGGNTNNTTKDVFWIAIGRWK